MAGEDSKPEKNVFRIGGNTFYDRKNKILMKIPEFKRSRIGLIAEFRGILKGFPNLDVVVPANDGCILRDLQSTSFALQQGKGTQSWGWH